MDFSKVKAMTIPEGEVALLYIDGKTVWRKAVEQLTPPTISLDGDTLTMTADDRTEEFVIFVGGVEMATVEAPKAEQETVTVSGTWYFNKSISPVDFEQSVNFTNNGVSYSRMSYSSYGDGNLYYDSTIVYSKSPHEPDQQTSWFNEAYRTITFDGVQTVSKEFYEWFVANAVRQIITFTINGTQYTALSGMTWGEWVESEYNTGNYFVENNYIKTGVTYVYLYGVGSVAPTANILANTEYEHRAGGGSN